MRKAHQLQLEKRTAEERLEYFRFRRLAIINGLVSLFSFWINFGLLYLAMDITATFGIVMGKESVLYLLPSVALAYICFKAAVYYRRKAELIRLGYHLNL